MAVQEQAVPADASTLTAGSDGLWSPQRRALTVGLVLTITFIASEALAVVTIMPVVARDLNGVSLYGWVFTAFMLGSLVGIVAAGRQADKFGPARPFLGGVLLFGAGLTIAGLAPSMAVLVAGRPSRASALARYPRWPTLPSGAACPSTCAPG
jgi:MFS family permease